MSHASKMHSCKDHTCMWGCLIHTVSVELKHEGILQNYSNFIVFMERNALLTSLSPELCAFSFHRDNHFVLKCNFFFFKTK